MRRRAFMLAPLLACAPLRAADYPVVTRGTPLSFPRDHGSHPAYRIEWWYITGWLQDAAGAELGVQVTFFRHRPGVAEDNPSRFAPKQLVFAHAAIAQASHGRLRHDQRVARDALGLAGTRESTTNAWIGDWSLVLEGDAYVAKVVARDFAFDLVFRATQPLLLQGDAGYSRKGPREDQASWYYSRPQLAASGRVTVGDRSRDVRGRAWLDHEWSSQYMAHEAAGWDWIGVNLDDGGALMAFRMRGGDGRDVWRGGARRDSDGHTRVFAPDDVHFAPRRTWTSPRTRTTYPVELDVRAGGVDYRIAPLMDDQELDAAISTGTLYWEGAIRVAASQGAGGRGYLELTGYATALAI